MGREFVSNRKLMLSFPPDIKTNEDKVVYALWREGTLSLTQLRLRTGLSTIDALEAVVALIDKGRIVAPDGPDSLSTTAGMLLPLALAS